MPQPPSKERSTFLAAARRLALGASPRRTAARAAVVALACYGVFGHVLVPVRLRGPSMEPTYRDGGFTFVNRLRYVFRSVERGDVVAIRLAGRRVMYFKRVVALAGDRVAFRRGTLLVNGRPVWEPYVVHRGDWNRAEEIVAPGEVFVVGDNRGASQRVHQFGRVSRARIVGGPLP